MRYRLSFFVLCLGLMFTFAAPGARAQFIQNPDSTTGKNLPAGHSPPNTLKRALLVPGWGQIYNRQYVKAGIYYAGLAATTYFVINTNQEYIQYRHATIYGEYRDVPEGERPEFYRDHFIDDYNAIMIDADLETEDMLDEDLQQERRERLTPSLRTTRDQLRRRRDLNIFLTFTVWGLGVLEAFVSAHLLHFDVDEDLTLQIVPHQQGLTASIRLQL